MGYYEIENLLMDDLSKVSVFEEFENVKAKYFGPYGVLNEKEKLVNNSPSKNRSLLLIQFNRVKARCYHFLEKKALELRLGMTSNNEFLNAYYHLNDEINHFLSTTDFYRICGLTKEKGHWENIPKFGTTFAKWEVDEYIKNICPEKYLELRIILFDSILNHDILVDTLKYPFERKVLWEPFMEHRNIMEQEFFSDYNQSASLKKAMQESKHE